MRKDCPCPVGDCPQHYQTARGLLRHHERVHGRQERLCTRRQLLPDGGRDRKHRRDSIVERVLAGQRPSDQLRESLMGETQ